jgi:hypothetical protein
MSAVFVVDFNLSIPSLAPLRNWDPHLIAKMMKELDKIIK